MRWIGYLLIATLLVGCGTAGDGQAPGSTTTTIPESTTTTIPDQPTTTIDVATTMSLPEGLSQDVLQEIVADAADRTGAAAEDAEIVSVEPQTFNDASLGCPEPGKMYAQVLTDGFVVLVVADGVELDYRVAEDSNGAVLCVEGSGKFIPPRAPIGDY